MEQAELLRMHEKVNAIEATLLGSELKDAYISNLNKEKERTLDIIVKLAMDSLTPESSV